MAAYQAAMAGEAPASAKKSGNGSLSWLVARYRETSAWASMSPATRCQRENILKHVLAASGDAQASEISRKHIVAGIDRRRATPGAARNFLKAMRGLFRWAVEAEHVATDPTLLARAPAQTGDGFHAWSEDEVTAFEAKWPLGTRQRLAFDILLFTGLRRGDAVILGRQHIRNGVAMLRTAKTGEPVAIPIYPPLAASIAAGPCGDLAFIASDAGKPMTKESFGNWFRDACRAAGVPGSAHGLRKAGANRAALSGATENELMALYGWSEPRTAAIYTRKANREKLAAKAGEKMNVYIQTDRKV
tara:strand:- start:319 stop:1227 length:909 start_codon:yes stop_codon:yes gene_type:complete